MAAHCIASDTDRFILFFILLLLRFYTTLFYIALSILSVLYCVYDFIINK